MTSRTAPPPDRLAALDWPALGRGLDAEGFATSGVLLSPAECRALAALYAQEGGFRSRVVMQRHGFGQGEYRYFERPLPDIVQGLREAIYPQLAAVANRLSPTPRWWLNAPPCPRTARVPASHASR